MTLLRIARITLATLTLTTSCLYFAAATGAQ